jgi:hypothetical protein
MKDCPNCEAPLHDHEAVCPRCGEKQYVRKSDIGSNLVDQKSTMSPVPAVLVIVLIVAGLLFAAQQSWIGQLIARGPVKQNPMDTITPPMARQMLEDKVTSNLSSVGAKGTFVWKQGDQKTDLNNPRPVSLDVETKLTDPKGQHVLIVEPAKGLMEKANVTTITLSDTKAHATWTYTLAPPAPEPDQSQPDQSQGDQSQ